jgi:hypothetical protein
MKLHRSVKSLAHIACVNKPLGSYEELIGTNIFFSKQVNLLVCNGTAYFEKCKQLLEYQNLLLLCDIWWLKL